MNLKKLSFLGFLLCTILPTTTWTMIENDGEITYQAQNENKQESFWRKYTPFFGQCFWFGVGALYTGTRVFLDKSEPTLKGFLSSSKDRVLWRSIGTASAFLFHTAMTSALKSIGRRVDIDQETRDNLNSLDQFFPIKRFLYLNTYKNILAHAAYREAFFHRASPLFSFASGFFWAGMLEASGSAFFNGKLFGSLLGVGLRYRHELGPKLKQTSQPVAIFVRSAVKYGLDKYRARTMAA
ncbi:MAG: hypothetical protein UV38_C0003G0164 [candidate division TM6 bacterium GW2011_GWE2_42_60]|nr:MAG: hypothetical protein UV38_C0003G0164 [candidate division TM6 bacterium GW2011_GWE2_42_60]HBY05361.1 hypothetical protein [Candidatus Dependentiae bacterium]